MYNRRYEKIFLMLRQETAGYAIGKRAPWGSCILELKNGTGRLQLTVQGLRPLRQAYGVSVLAGEESIFCGHLMPDAKEGYAVLKWDFAPDAIGAGKCVEDIHTILILAEYGTNGVSAPLLAYVAEERDWRSIFSAARLPMQAAQPAESEQHMKPVESAESIPLRAAEAAVLPRLQEKKQDAPCNTNAAIAQAQQSSYHGSFQGLLAKFRQELRELEEGGILSAQEVEKIRGGNAASPKKRKSDTNIAEKAKIEPPKEAVSMPVEETAASQNDPFAQNLELQPFGEGERWKCISLGELTLLAQIPLKWQREFFFLLPQRRYHHLILREGEDGIWLGLPASYTESDAADAKKFGFDLFRRVDGEWGYWLARLEKAESDNAAR